MRCYDSVPSMANQEHPDTLAKGNFPWARWRAVNAGVTPDAPSAARARDWPAGATACRARRQRDGSSRKRRERRRFSVVVDDAAFASRAFRRALARWARRARQSVRAKIELRDPRARAVTRLSSGRPCVANFAGAVRFATRANKAGLSSRIRNGRRGASPVAALRRAIARLARECRPGAVPRLSSHRCRLRDSPAERVEARFGAIPKRPEALFTPLKIAH